MMWFFSQNEEDWVGPFGSREQALAAGLREYHDEGFVVVKARTSDYRMVLDEHQLFAALHQQNKDRSDPERNPMLADVSTFERADLVAKVNLAILTWVHDNHIDIGALILKDNWEIETIPPEENETAPDEPLPTDADDCLVS